MPKWLYACPKYLMKLVTKNIAILTQTEIDGLTMTPVSI